MRKIILSIISLCAISVAHANSCSDSAVATECKLPTSSPISEIVPNKYAEVGLTTEQVDKFIQRLKHDVSVTNGLMPYVTPLYEWRGKKVYGNLNCNNAKTGEIKHISLTPKFVAKHYNYLFNNKTKQIINDQTESGIFVRNNGLMFGNGELWFYVVNESNLAINAINVDSKCPQ